MNPTTLRGVAPLGRPDAHGLPRLRVALDRDVSFWAGGLMAMGGSPWRVIRLAETARPFVQELREAGATGCVPTSWRDRAVARHLLNRGVVHPVVQARSTRPPMTVVVPAFDRAEQLDACLSSLKLRLSRPVERLGVGPDAFGCRSRCPGKGRKIEFTKSRWATTCWRSAQRLEDRAGKGHLLLGGRCLGDRRSSVAGRQTLACSAAVHGTPATGWSDWMFGRTQDGPSRGAPVT